MRVFLVTLAWTLFGVFLVLACCAAALSLSPWIYVGGG